MLTSNISWHTSIYTQADTQQALDSLNGVGILIFWQISQLNTQESLQNQLHGVVKAC